MINPVTIGLLKQDGTKYYVLIEPMLEKAGDTLKSTGTFKLYKDAVGDESALFTEPRELEEGAAVLPDEANPDYIGTIILKSDDKWQYQGDLLNHHEQSQVAAYIKNSQ